MFVASIRSASAAPDPAQSPTSRRYFPSPDLASGRAHSSVAYPTAMTPLQFLLTNATKRCLLRGVPRRTVALPQTETDQPNPPRLKVGGPARAPEPRHDRSRVP